MFIEIEASHCYFTFSSKIVTTNNRYPIKILADRKKEFLCLENMSIAPH